MSERIFRIGKHTEVYIDFDRSYVETRYEGLPPVQARPEGTEEYEARARSLGYHNGMEMNREHDACRSLVCCWMGLPLSPTLYGVASKQPAPLIIREWEERLVLAFQAWLRLGKHHFDLCVIPDLPGLTARALQLLKYD